MILGTQDPFNHLPVELILRIFDYVHPYDVWSKRLVCRRWNSVLSSPKVMHAAISRFATHDPKDSALDPNASVADDMDGALRHVLALRLGRPFSSLSIKDSIAIDPLSQPKPNIPRFQLKGSYIAYLRGKNEGNRLLETYQSDTVVIRSLLTGRSAALHVKPGDVIQSLTLSTEFIAFVTHDGSLYIEPVLDLVNWQEPAADTTLSTNSYSENLQRRRGDYQIQSDESAAMAPTKTNAAFNTPQQSVRLPSSFIVAMASDQEVVVCLLHSSDGDSGFIYDAHTRTSSSFRLQTPNRATDEIACQHSLLVDSPSRRIDVFTLATTGSPNKSHAHFDLRVISSRYSFNGDLLAQTTWEGGLGDMEPNYIILGPVHPSGHKGIHAIDVTFNGPSALATDKCRNRRLSLLFDETTLNIKAVDLPEHVVRDPQYQTQTILWKDMVYRTRRIGNCLVTFWPSEPTDEPVHLLTHLLRDYPPQPLDNGSFSLGISGSSPRYRCQHVFETRMRRRETGRGCNLFMNDTFAIQAFSQSSRIVAHCFDERVSMYGQVSTREWSKHDRANNKRRRR